VNASSHQGGTLRLAMSGDWDSPDTGNTYYAYSWDFLRLYSRSLLTYAQKPGAAGLALVPDLATDTGTVSSDGLTWTFHIRQGVKYQDGTEVTAQDVKYAVERSNWGQDTLQNGPTYFKQYVQDSTNYQGPYKDKNASDGVSGIVTPDSSTIEFKLTQKFADFPYMAALPSTAPVPRAKDTGASYQTSYDSTGQYEIQNYTPGKGMTLVPNSAFSASTDPNGIHKVTANKITVAVNVSQDQVDQGLLHGTYDVDLSGVGVGTTAQAQILASPALKAQSDNGYTGALTYMNMNTQIQPFDNIDCRKAVELAIDKTAVQAALGGSIGGGDIATTVMPPNLTGYQASNQYNTPGNQGDVTAAKAELAKCRTAEPAAFDANGGFSTNLSARTERPKEVNSAIAIQNSLKAIGINVTIQKFTSGKYFSDFAGKPDYVKTNKIGLMMMKWGADWPDGFGFLDQIITKDGIHPSGGSTNLGSYDSPAVDALFTQALSTVDATQRASYWGQIDKAVMSDAAIVPLIYNKALFYHPSTVTNWYLQNSFGEPDFSVMGTTSTS
jgi:peptide/nickel transport system substrate-binding protein